MMDAAREVIMKKVVLSSWSWMAVVAAVAFLTANLTVICSGGDVIERISAPFFNFRAHRQPQMQAMAGYDDCIQRWN